MNSSTYKLTNAEIPKTNVLPLTVSHYLLTAPPKTPSTTSPNILNP